MPAAAPDAASGVSAGVTAWPTLPMAFSSGMPDPSRFMPVGGSCLTSPADPTARAGPGPTQARARWSSPLR